MEYPALSHGVHPTIGNRGRNASRVSGVWAFMPRNGPCRMGVFSVCLMSAAENSREIQQACRGQTPRGPFQSNRLSLTLGRFGNTLGRTACKNSNRKMRSKNGRPFCSDGAGGGGRTHMPSEGRGILSPVRLPVPPLQQVYDSLEFTILAARGTVLETVLVLCWFGRDHLPKLLLANELTRPIGSTRGMWVHDRLAR